MKKYNIFNKIMLGIVGLLIISVVGCDDDKPGKYEMTGGTPEVHYVRLTDPTFADSLLIGAYMQQTIALIGENFRSIQELWFNDQQAVLNINMITDNALIVTVPRTIPEDVTDKIYMVTQHKDTIPYDFQVLVPTPLLGRLKCEWVNEGEEAVIIGDYLLDDPDVPLRVVFAGNIEGEVVGANKTSARVIVPQGALEGPITVASRYGTSRSTFYFRDSRGWITGFEDTENAGQGFVAGWGRPGTIEEDPTFALNGKYVRMAGSVTPGENDSWASGGENLTINIWSSDNESNPNIDIPNPMFSSDPKTSILKMEVYVLETWSAAPMIFAFDNANGLENYLWADTTQPRGFWAPWVETGSYVSDGWETISIPLSDMKYNGSEEEISVATEFGQLGISIHNRGGATYIGTSCNPVILVDNVRVIPGE